MSVYRKRLEVDPNCQAAEHGGKRCSCRFSENWYISFTADGVMHREMVGSKADAVKEHKRRVAAVADGKIGRRKTLRQYTFENWPIGHSGETHAANEKFALDKHLLPRFGAMQLSEINGGKVARLQIALEKSGLKPPSVNWVMRLLKKILLDAYRNGVLAVFPAPHWPKALAEKPLALELSADEQIAFEGTFDDRAGFMNRIAADRKKAAPLLSSHYAKPRVFGGGRIPESETASADYGRFNASKALFIVALETGLDRGELIDLRWKAPDGQTGVDLKAGVITGRRKKTDETYDIPISSRCRAALNECERRSVSGHVFTTETGDPYSVERIKRYFKLAKRLAGIKRRLRFKDLRHTLGCRLASAQVSDAIIGAVLGHSPRSNMARRYARPSKTSQRTAVLAALNG